LKTLEGGPPHPAAAGLVEAYARGETDRRSVLAALSWLGVALPAGPLLGGCAQTEALGGRKRLRFACAVQEITDPALTSWIEASNLFRNSLEFLTEVDADNITRPYLAESWTASEDLKTWRFTLRKNVFWSNGDPFTTRDVAFNFARWLRPQSQSVNRTAFSAIEAFEAQGEHAFVLHLSRPVCALPEQLYAFTCPMLHHRFEIEGGDWPKNPVGTGPFALTHFDVGREARFRRRSGYWGAPPKVEELLYVDLGPEPATHVAALAAGQVDVLYRVTIAELDLVRRLPKVRLLRTLAAQTAVIRMQVDAKPFDDIRIRRAVQAAADNAAMLRFAYRGMGVVGENVHVAPFQPDYGPLAAAPRDVSKARRLLAEAGRPGGIDLALTLGNTQGRWEEDTAQVLQQNCLEAGIRIRLNVLPPAEYWSIWNKTPFGLTYWSHRPLGVMLYDVAYRTGSAWNESRFADKRFDASLDRAMAILDPVRRRTAMTAAETILRDAAVMVQPFWAEKFVAVSSDVVGHRAHPSDFFRMDRVGLR
jgi:peptide/nickel transport system substrate-binding protein